MKASISTKCILLALSFVICFTLCACGSINEVQSVPTIEPTPSAPVATVSPMPTLELEPSETPATATPTSGPQVVITKSPTDESVSAGGKAWFIAHADNANSISWSFTSPDDGSTLTTDELSAQFPGLETEVLPEDTLALRNIPLEMDGWKVRAHFVGDWNSAETDQAVIYVSDYLSSYSSVIDNCRLISNMTDYNQVLTEDTYGLLESLDLMKAPASLGYVLKDIDGNGIPEMLIGATGANDFGENGGNIVYSLFTLEDGNPTKVFASRARSRYYMSSLGSFYYHGSNGAANSFSYIYTLNGKELYVTDGVWTDGVNENGVIIAYHTDSSQTDGTPITQEQLAGYTEQYEASVMPLPALVPIT